MIALSVFSLHQPCGVCLVLKTGGPCLFFENACCKKWKDYPAFACSPHNSSTGCSICALSVAPPRSSGTVSPLPAPGAGTRLRGPKKRNERRRYKGCFLPRPPSVASSTPYAEVTGRATSRQFFSVVLFFVSAGVASSSTTSSRATAALCAIFLRLDLLPQAGATASSAMSFCSVRFFFFFPLCLYVKSCSCREWRNEVFSFLLLFFLFFTFASSDYYDGRAARRLPPAATKSHDKSCTGFRCVTEDCCYCCICCVCVCVCARVCVCVCLHVFVLSVVYWVSNCARCFSRYVRPALLFVVVLLISLITFF